MEAPTGDLADAMKNMQNDPELMAAFVEAQAELEGKKSKKKKKKKKKQVGDQLAELEQMMAQLEQGEGDMDLETAAATLKMLEDESAPKKTKKKKIKKEKLPAPFEPAPAEEETLPEEFNVAINYEPTEEEIEAEFQKLKAEQEAKKKKKEKEKRRQERNLLRDEDGNIVTDENGVPMTLDSLADLLGDEDLEDEEMKAYLEKKKKKAKKKKKIKKEKKDPQYDEFDPSQFAEDGDFGWAKKDANQKQFKPGKLRKTGDSSMEVDGEAVIDETEEEAARRKAREAGEELAPADAPVVDEDFGPTLPATGIPARAETGAIPGGSKLKPIEDDEVIEERLRQKQLQKAIQERLDRRLQRQKRIEVRLSTWINKQQSLKNEAKQIAEERIQRAQEITEAMAPGIHAQNEEYMKKRADIVAEVRNKLRQEVSDEVRREIEEEENRKIRRTEKAPEAPKVPAAVMDAIQMSDAWEQFWRRYKSQLQNWSHWDEEQEEYHKQAAGWYFTQGFIQSQVQSNVPAAPSDDPSKAVDDPDAHAAENVTGETTIDAKMVSSATIGSAPIMAGEEKVPDAPAVPGVNVPAPPTHTLEEEERIEKLENKKKKKLDRYDELLKDPIFNPKQDPVYQPWGAKDGEIRAQPGLVAAGITAAPDGASFAPKASAMSDTEKAKLSRMQRMLATVRGPQAMRQQTVGTTFLPTQSDALQFIQLERFRRDRHRFRSSDHDSETESEDEAPRERGAKNLPYLPQMQYGGSETLTQASTQADQMAATDINQPGEMVNPAGETIEASSSSDSSDSETEEQKERRLKMAAKFNPANIYGADTVVEPAKKAEPKKVQIRRFDGRTDTTVAEVAEDGFGFDFLGGADKTPNVTMTEGAGPSGASKQVTKKAKLYDRSKYVPDHLPQEPKGQGFHQEGPLKGLPKMWKQEQGLRQRPRESAQQQFVEISEEHLPPKQLGLPEYVQDIPDAPTTSEDVKNMATMAVRDYQREHLLMERKKTRMEEYMERRNADKRFAAEPVKPKESTPTGANIDLQEESLDFDPASFFGTQTGGMFTSSKSTAEADEKKKKKATPKPPKEPVKPSEAAKKAFDLPQEGDKPKKRFAGFGASWKKKTVEPTKIALKTTIEEPAKPAEEKKDEDELPDFLKEQEKLMEGGDEAKTDAKDDGFWTSKEVKPKKRKGTKDKKRKEGAEEVLGEENGEKKSKRKKFQAGWMDRMGEDPDKPLKESSAGMEIDESELRTYNDGNPKDPDQPEKTADERTAGDRDDRDWGAWKPRSRQVAVKEDEKNKVAIPRKEGELSELHKKLLDPARFDYDPDFARAGSLQFMHPLQCSKVLGRPYPEDLVNKGQKALDDDITAYREPAPIQDPAELGPEPPPDGAIFWGVPEEVLTDPRLVVLKVGVPENCPGPEPRGWLDGLKRRKWYEKAQAPEIRPVHPASYFKRGDQLHQDKTFGVFYHPKYYGITKEQKAAALQSSQDAALADSRASLAASFQKGGQL